MTAEPLAPLTCSSAAELPAAVHPSADGRSITDPATGQLVGRAPEHTVADLEAAVTVARAVQRGWACRGHAERSALLHAPADALEADAEALAELLSREQGKPLNGPSARFEVGACAAWLRDALPAGGCRRRRHLPPSTVLGGRWARVGLGCVEGHGARGGRFKPPARPPGSAMASRRRRP